MFLNAACFEWGYSRDFRPPSVLATLLGPPVVLARARTTQEPVDERQDHDREEGSADHRDGVDSGVAVPGVEYDVPLHGILLIPRCREYFGLARRDGASARLRAG